MQRDLHIIWDTQLSHHRSIDTTKSSSLTFDLSSVAVPKEKKEWSDVKLVILMTTHLSQLHIKFLPCWYDAIQRLEIFQYADLILYIPSSSVYDLNKVLKQLPFRHPVRVEYYNNTGYQNGAIQAMIDPYIATKNNGSWFDDYDWVIRLNPDVLIRNDTWLISTMMNDSIDAIFHDCYNRQLYPSIPINQDDDDDNNNDHRLSLLPSSLSLTSIPKFHTDFTAFRPRAIHRDLVLSAATTVVTFNNRNDSKSTTTAGTTSTSTTILPKLNAEMHYTRAVWNIYQSQRFVYVLGGYNSVPGNCRIEGIHSPIVHVHELVNYCPYYYNVTRTGVY
jgi:hypothetical protein